MGHSSLLKSRVAVCQSFLFLKVYSVPFLDDLLSASHFSGYAGKWCLKQSLDDILGWDSDIQLSSK